MVEYLNVELSLGSEDSGKLWIVFPYFSPQDIFNLYIFYESLTNSESSEALLSKIKEIDKIFESPKKVSVVKQL